MPSKPALPPAPTAEQAALAARAADATVAALLKAGHNYPADQVTAFRESVRQKVLAGLMAQAGQVPEGTSSAPTETVPPPAADDEVLPFTFVNLVKVLARLAIKLAWYSVSRPVPPDRRG